MAKLTDPLAQERPTPRPIGGIVQLREAGPGDIGKGLQQLGASIESGAEEIYRAQQIEEDRADTMLAEGAFTKLRERQLDLSLGDNGYSKLKGEAAVTKPVFKEWSKRFDEAMQETAATLANDRQRERFMARAQVSKLQYQEGILRHISSEGEVYAKENYDGVIAIETRNAAANWLVPNDIGSSLERVKNAVAERADRYDWPKAYQDAVLLTEQGKIHSTVVQQALANGNYVYAEQWYERNKDMVDPATAATLAKAVESGTQRQLFADYTREFIGLKKDMRGLDALQNKVVSDQTLDDTRKNTLLNQIINQKTTLERHAEVERNRREAVIQKAIGQVNDNILAGYPPSADQTQPILDATKGTDLEQDALRMQALADATSRFRLLTPLQRAQEITNFEIAMRKDPTKFDRRILDAWKAINENQIKDATKDPVTFSERQGFSDPILLDISKPDPTALAQRFAVARAIARKEGAPFKPLKEHDVNLLKQVLDGAQPQEKQAYFAQLYSASQNDKEGYSAIMAQLAPDMPVTAIAGEYTAKGRLQAADLMLRGEAVLNPKKKEDGSPDRGVLLPMPAESHFRSAFDKTVQGAYSGRAEVRSAMYQSAKAIYAALSVTAGDKDTSVIDDDRWEQAITMATGGIEKYRGRQIVLPYGMDIDVFKDQLSARMDALSGSLSDYITADRLMDLPLQSVGDGRYIILSGDLPLVDKNGFRVVVDFNKPLPSVVQPRTPRAGARGTPEVQVRPASVTTPPTNEEIPAWPGLEPQQRKPAVTPNIKAPEPKPGTIVVPKEKELSTDERLKQIREEQAVINARREKLRQESEAAKKRIREMDDRLEKIRKEREAAKRDEKKK